MVVDGTVSTPTHGAQMSARTRQEQALNKHVKGGLDAVSPVRPQAPTRDHSFNLVGCQQLSSPPKWQHLNTGMG